jgi:hypothetical protein
VQFIPRIAVTRFLSGSRFGSRFGKMRGFGGIMLSI